MKGAAALLNIAGAACTAHRLMSRLVQLACCILYHSDGRNLFLQETAAGAAQGARETAASATERARQAAAEQVG